MTKTAICGLALLGLVTLGGCTPAGLLAGGVALALTPGSTHPMQGHEQYPDHGNATRNNAAMHIIDPAPAAAQNTDLEMDGDRALLAIDRYKTGKVIEPEDLTTQSTQN